MNQISNVTSSNLNFGTENEIGTPSDYILIAMIIAMMLCMAVCCVCLFCRTTSRNLSVCGYTCEVNNSRNASIAIEDVSELHEVVPLTPAVVEAPNLPDIENKLKSDPPPPQYNEVVSTNVLDRFRWRSKRKTTNGDDSVSSRKASESVVRSKSRKSEKKSRPSLTFSRKANSKTNKESRSTDLPTTIEVDVAQDTHKPNNEECAVAIPESLKEQEVVQPTEGTRQEIEGNPKHSSDLNNKNPDTMDDEVFM